MENAASIRAGTRVFPPPTRRLPGSACGPSRRPGDRRGGSVCAARVRVRVGPRRHARLRPPLGGVSWTGYEDPYGPADVTDPRSLRPSDGGWRSRGSAALFIRTRLRGLCPHYREGRASQAHVQRKRHSGLTLGARGAEPRGVDLATVRACGLRDPRRTLSLLTSPLPGDLTSSLPLWPGRVPASAWVLRETIL